MATYQKLGGKIALNVLYIHNKFRHNSFEMLVVVPASNWYNFLKLGFIEIYNSKNFIVMQREKSLL